MKWLIKPIKVENKKMELLMKMLSSVDIAFDIVHTLDGKLYDKEKKPYILRDEEKYFVCGSYQLTKVVSQTHKEASFVLDDYTFKDWYDIFGKENMLNENIQIAEAKDIIWINEEMFVRPLLDSKAFNGGIFNKNTLNTDVICVAATLQHIQKEFRFFVLDGEIIGSSQYKMNGELFPSSIVDEDAKQFVNEMIKKFDFPGYVIDIASTNGQCKIVELNCFNASGFYEIDLWKFMEKVTNYYENKVILKNNNRMKI